jgi:hypothetical protein
MAVAEVTNIVIEKGTDFEATFNLFDPDQSATVLSGLSTTYASIRKYPDSTTGEEFSKTITAGTGTIKLTLTSTQTTNLKAGRNYFDVVLTLSGKKIKVIKGTAIVEESASV